MPICPNCHQHCIQRVHGVWCPRCRGWHMTYIKPNGVAYPFIQAYRYLP